MVSDLFQGRTAYRSEADGLRLFRAVVSQVSKNLKQATTHVDAIPVLASYFTQVEPLVGGEAFCVALAKGTVLFHAQLNHAAEADMVLYGQLLAHAVSMIPLQQQEHHPLLSVVIREMIFGLDGPKKHAVVLVPPQSFRAFSTLATTMLFSGALPHLVIEEWFDHLERYSCASSPMVSFRAKRLLLRTSDVETVEESMQALRETLAKKPKSLNIDFILLCFERLQRVAVDVSNGPTFVRALCVICSEIFLRFRSPIRRQYVECYLFPSLINEDTRQLIDAPETKKYLCGELLRLCSPTMTPSCPFYTCLCAIIQPLLVDGESSAEEVVELFDCQMPHAAYFMATMALDKNVPVKLFAELVLSLVKGAGYVMNGRNVDQLTTAMDSSTMVYNVFFSIREVVSKLGSNSSNRSAKVMQALRSAVPVVVINTLGQFAASAFDGICDIPIDPQLLCAELGMTLHHQNVDEAVDTVLEHIRDASSLCHFCNKSKSSSIVCTMNGTIHLAGHASLVRVVTALSECLGSSVVHRKLIATLRQKPCDAAVHFLIFQLLKDAKQFRQPLFNVLDPYITDTLSVLSGTRAATSSNDRANIIAFHSRLLWLMGSSIEPHRVQAVVKSMSKVMLSNNQDALSVWYAANFLLRNINSDSIEISPLITEEMDDKRISHNTGQLLLRFLDKAHSYSDETRKLTGPCVAKLIQDFNMQAPNIIQSLLAPFGSVSCCADSLLQYALPCHPSTTFWSFVTKQLNDSPPMRTSMIVSLVKSMSSRFRSEHPSQSMVASGTEPMAPLFAVMTIETLKRSPVLAQMMLQLLCLWVAQGNHSPGKYVCLVYTCQQLTENLHDSRDFLNCKRVSTGSNASIDAMINALEKIINKTKDVLSSQLHTLSQLQDATQHNEEFAAIVEKVKEGVQFSVDASASEDMHDDAIVQSFAEHAENTIDDAVAVGEEVFDGELADFNEPSDCDSTARSASSENHQRFDSTATDPLQQPGRIVQDNKKNTRAVDVPSTSHPEINARATGVSIPSDLVFELLSTMQSSSSIIFELEQFDVDDHAKPVSHMASVVQPFQVEMESRPNNYSVPHSSTGPAQSTRVMAAMQPPARSEGSTVTAAVQQLSEAPAPPAAPSAALRLLALQTRDSVLHELAPSRPALQGAQTPAHVPVEFVEQGHDTVLRELRQMTNTNGTVRASQKMPGPPQSTRFAATDENGDMFAMGAPTPAYATAAQYSLEFI